MSCIKCSIFIDQSVDKYVKCDGCSRIVHVGCSELNETELKCFSLRSGSKRRMKYICVECEQGVHQIPKLVALLNDMRDEIRELNDRYAGLSVAQASVSSVDVFATEEIISEINQRNERARNVMVYGAVEDGVSKANQTELDVALVGGLLGEAGVMDEVVAPLRLGKFDGTKRPRARPIKLRLSSSESVTILLRKFREIKTNPDYSHLSISPDRTPRQIAVFKAVKEQLNNRVAAGETDLRIKYQNGIPSIVRAEN